MIWRQLRFQPRRQLAAVPTLRHPRLPINASAVNPQALDAMLRLRELKCTFERMGTVDSTLFPQSLAGGLKCILGRLEIVMRTPAVIKVIHSVSLREEGRLLPVSCSKQDFAILSKPSHVSTACFATPTLGLTFAWHEHTHRFRIAY